MEIGVEERRLAIEVCDTVDTNANRYATSQTRCR